MRLLIALLPLLCMPCANAADAAPNLAGVWQGTLGNGGIVACFNGMLDNGSYYYTRYKTPIQLQKDDKTQRWNEAGSTGSWALAPSATGIEGTWTDPKTGKSQALTLTLLKETGTQAACASDAYNTPLEAMPPLQLGKVELFEGKKFRRLRIANYRSVELLDTSAQIASINRDLRAMLPTGIGDMSDYFEKRRIFLGETGRPEEDDTRSAPVFWSARWVTVHFYRWAAGFGSDAMSTDYYTWDLRSGAKVDPWAWFAGKNAAGGDVAAMPAALDKYFQKTAKLNGDCKDGYPGQGYFHLSVGDQGMRFWEEARGSGCEQAFDLPYSKMTPFLTPAGKAALKTLLPQ